MKFVDEKLNPDEKLTVGDKELKYDILTYWQLNLSSLLLNMTRGGFADAFDMGNLPEDCVGLFVDHHPAATGKRAHVPGLPEQSLYRPLWYWLPRGHYYLLPFLKLHVRQSIWRLSGMVFPPFDFCVLLHVTAFMMNDHSHIEILH